MEKVVAASNGNFIYKIIKVHTRCFIPTQFIDFIFTKVAFILLAMCVYVVRRLEKESQNSFLIKITDILFIFIKKTIDIN
jgi:hypothetical protein